MLELKNITYKIIDKGIEKTILNNVSCAFEDNCLTAITGHNGSGKSTLTKIIMGLIKPTSGEVNVSTDIGYMFQHDHLFEWRTIYKNILLGLDLCPLRLYPVDLDRYRPLFRTG